MKRSMFAWLLLLPALVVAQNPAKPAPAPSRAQENLLEIQYEPGNVLPLPFQNCEVRTRAKADPYPFKMPVNVEIYVYTPETGKRSGPIFQGSLSKPMKLEVGYYSIDGQGIDKPIIVAYGIKIAPRTYKIYRNKTYMVGNFIIPGTARLPASGQYTVSFKTVDMPVRCRHKERAVIEVPGYKGLPPFLEPAEGAAWPE